MDNFEAQIQRTTQHFPYPPTPMLQREPATDKTPFRTRNYVLRAAASVVLLLVIVMVTPLRAAVLEWLQIGAITIIIGEQPTVTPALPSLMNLFGETTLAEARTAVGFPLRLPEGFGPPDHVYQQRVDGDVIIMVWLPHDNRPALSLFQFAPTSDTYIKPLSMIQNVRVNGQPALWTDQFPHRLEYDNGTQRAALLVEGSVLIWQENEITYRIESGLSLEEAVRIAESLR